MKKRLTYLLCALIAFSVGGIGTFFINKEQTENSTTHLETADSATPTNQPPGFAFDIDEVDVSNPYELALSINGRYDVPTGKLWDRLGIGKRFNGLRGWNTPDVFLAYCEFCNAEYSEFDLDHEPGSEVLVRIANSIEESRYLVFKENRLTGNFVLVGHIDHNFGRHKMPSHSYVVSRGRGYLVIQFQTVSGTGVSGYVNRMFTVRNGKLEEILSFPAVGHEAMGAIEPNREFSGQVTDIISKGETTQVELRLTVTYKLYHPRFRDRFKTWTKNERAVFIKSPENDFAVLEESRSTISQAEYDAVYHHGGLSDKEFDTFNRNEIRTSQWRIRR
jgi:hypothetical protein